MPNRVQDPRTSQWYVLDEKLNRWRIEDKVTGKPGSFVKGDIVKAAMESATPAPESKAPGPYLDRLLLSISKQLTNVQMVITSIHEKMAQPDTKLDELGVQVDTLKQEVSRTGQVISAFAKLHDKCDEFPKFMDEVSRTLKTLEELKTNLQILASKPAAPTAAPEIVVPKPAASAVAEEPADKAVPAAKRNYGSVGKTMLYGVVCVAVFFLGLVVFSGLRSTLNEAFQKERGPVVTQNVPPALVPEAKKPEAEKAPPASLPEEKKEVEKQPAEAPPPKADEQKQVAVEPPPQDSRCSVTGTIFVDQLGRCVFPQ